jgi:hypothetical protein
MRQPPAAPPLHLQHVLDYQGALRVHAAHKLVHLQVRSSGEQVLVQSSQPAIRSHLITRIESKRIAPKPAPHLMNAAEQRQLGH